MMTQQDQPSLMSGTGQGWGASHLPPPQAAVPFPQRLLRLLRLLAIIGGSELLKPSGCNLP